MKKTNRFIALLLALTLLLGAMMGTLTSCVTPETPPDGPGDGPGPGTGPDTKITYTVSVKTVGGMPLKDVVVTVFEDDTLEDLEGYAKTDSNGIATVTLKQKDGYAVMLSSVPEGYDVKEYYTFTGASCAITLTSKIVDDTSLSGVKYELGSIMRDFTVRTVDGENVTLSELLKTKKAVMLNFWYIDCTWCKEEFPYMESAYQRYSDDVEIVALNPIDMEELNIRLFREDYGLSFEIAKDNIGLTQAFGVNSFPTSVMIDRYGAICLVISGAISGEKYFKAIFDHFTAVDYEQKLLYTYEDLAPQEKPNITQAPSDEIASAIEKEDLGATYYPETGTNDSEYSWPFIVGEKDGKPCITTPIAAKDNAFATIHMDVELEAGEALMFDYFLSTELGSDMLYVLVDGVSINTLSGISEEWKSLCAYVAKETATYKLTLIYLKDDSKDVGDDAVYISNMRVVDQTDVDVMTFIPRWVATKPNANGLGYQSYETVVFNAEDGYYHVGTADGPLLLANLMGVTPFSSSDSMYSIVYAAYQAGETAAGAFGELAKNYDAIVKYCNYASNAKINGVCTVNETLAGFLKLVTEAAGLESDNPSEWLQLCLYYDTYATDGAQLEDPIIGLAPHSAYPTVVNGENDPDDYFPNKVTYDRVLMPRGLWYAFTPTVSGAYYIASNAPDASNGEGKTDMSKTLNGWIFLEDGSRYYEYSINVRKPNDITNVYMYAYFEAGKTYYIDIAYYDLYNFDSFSFKIEYLGESYDHLRAVSPGAPFTYLVDDKGNITETVIPGGVKVWYDNENDCYKNILPDGTHGDSVIYADFTFFTSIFSNKNLCQMIEIGAFDFRKTENDHLGEIYISDYTETELRELWGDEYDANYDLYNIADIKNGKFHGKGKDETDLARKYAEMVINDKTMIDGEPAPEELYGCVAVTKELADLLQKLMDKYTFENVENSWVKLCYFYEKLEAGWKYTSDY